jgi:hypothetical protein
LEWPSPTLRPRSRYVRGRRVLVNYGCIVQISFVWYNLTQGGWVLLARLLPEWAKLVCCLTMLATLTTSFGMLPQLAQKLESTTADLMAAHEELDILKRSFGEKIDQSKQFQQLRKMITSKNDQLKEVRVRLARYESDDTPLAED